MGPRPVAPSLPPLGELTPNAQTVWSSERVCPVLQQAAVVRHPNTQDTETGYSSEVNPQQPSKLEATLGYIDTISKTSNSVSTLQTTVRHTYADRLLDYREAETQPRLLFCFVFHPRKLFLSSSFWSHRDSPTLLSQGLCC